MIQKYGVFEGQFAFVDDKRQAKHGVHNFRLAVPPSKNTEEVFATLRLNHYHLVIESTLQRKALPSRFFTFEVDPAHLINGLLRLVQPSEYDIVFIVNAGCVILASFYVLPTSLHQLPIVLGCRVN